MKARLSFLKLHQWPQVRRFRNSNHMLPSTQFAVCRVGKGGPDVSIDPRRQIRRAHQQRRGGHGGTRAVPYGHASAAFAHPMMLHPIPRFNSPFPKAWEGLRAS
jgi:hypothetical protein